MLKQLIFQSLNGFSYHDIPFLILQLSVSSILVFVVRLFWVKEIRSDEEKIFLKYLIPLQIVLTTLAVFSIKSPWIVILFALISMFPVIGTNLISLRFKVFYSIAVFIAFGCGTMNIVVTTFIVIFLIVPILFINRK